MCNPAAIVMAVMSVASTAMSVAAQSQQIEAMNDQANAARSASEANTKMEADAAANAAAQDYMAVGAQQDEINQQAAQEKQQRALLAMRERAALRVSAGEAGLAGGVVDGAIKDTYMNESADMGTLEANRANKIKQAQLSKGQIQATAQGRVNQGISNMRSTFAQNPNKTAPSAWVSGLQIGMAGASGAMQGYAYGQSLPKDSWANKKLWGS